MNIPNFEPKPVTCEICGSTNLQNGYTILNRKYLQCQDCFILLMEKSYLPSLEDERMRYDQHHNEGDGYRKYMTAQLDVFSREIKLGERHLDYGCGPNPLLSEIINTEGCNSDYYDPIFFPKQLLRQRYDIITLIEVAEHFHEPINEFRKIRSMLAKFGRIIVLTNMYDELDANWWYLRDLTHTTLYNRRTVNHLASVLDTRFELLPNLKGFILRSE